MRAIILLIFFVLLFFYLGFFAIVASVAKKHLLADRLGMLVRRIFMAGVLVLTVISIILSVAVKPSEIKLPDLGGKILTPL